MSDRSFRDRLAHIADNIDLEQLDGLIVNRIEPNYSTEEDQPSLQRLFLGLEDNQSLPPSAVSPPVVMNEVNLKIKKFIKICKYWGTIILHKSINFGENRNDNRFRYLHSQHKKCFENVEYIFCRDVFYLRQIQSWKIQGKLQV